MSSERVFTNFKEASLFAREQSISSRTTLRVARKNGSWVVLSKGQPHLGAANTIREKELEEKIKELEKTLRDSESNRLKERERYLQGKRRIYSSSSTEELYELAKSHLNYTLSLEEDELQMLLPILQPYLTEIKDSNKKEEAHYFKEKRKYYLSLSVEELEGLWTAREWSDSSTWAEQSPEKSEDLLREVLRQKKGIGNEKWRGSTPRFCGKCGFVEDNCACERRSWW